ncbi:unnamed protein product [Prorocentrum cordatum]|uniref:ShKT domain-containing protein n=1 Tax=Prorocentrum cordatum TaxID=2364126 RepID=A0ABN9X6L9_9DINO|nr:unnamed protein product [Polarella glacialis]
MRSRASHFYQRVLGVGGKLFFPRVVAVQTSGMLLQAVGKLSLLGAMVTTLRLQPPLNRPPRPSVDLSPGFWALVSTLVAHALFVGVYVGGLTRGASAAKQTIVGMLGPLLLQVSYILSYGACAFLVVQQGEILPASVTQDDKRAVDTDFFATDVVVGALSRPDKSFAFPDLTRPVAFFALALPAVGLMLTTRAVEERLAFLGHAARAAHSAQPPAGRTSRPRLSDHVPGPMLFGSPVGRAHATRPRHRCAAAAGALVSLVSLGLLFAILMVGNSDRFPLEPVPGCFPCWCPSEGELRSCGVAVDMRYKVLSLERAGITRIRPGAFSPSNFVSSPNLILEASFRGNALDELEEGTFQHMSYVTRLDLRDNSLRAIAPGAFEGLARAEDLLLDLSWVLTEEKSRCGGAGTCRLPALTVGSFLGLPRLRILGLGLSGAAGSGVPSVEPGAFSGLGSLEVLRLDSCACFDSLGRLPPGFFDGLGQLRVLVFSGTSLSRVSPGDFAGTPSLRVLDLHGTRLAEGGLEVQPGAFQELAQLRLLDLSDVQLEDLQPGALAGLVELRHLTLGNNALQRLRAGAMSGLGNLEELDLSGNPLTEVEPAALDDLSTPPLQSLSILRTPLQSQALACTADEDDCRDSFLAVWRLTRTFLSDVFVGGLGCSDARSLCGVDKGGTVIDPVCPVTCGTCGSLSDDGSAADCVDKDWAMTYTSTLASGVQLESGWPGADNTEWPLSRWTTCAHMVAAGACEHFYWNDVATLVCPVACGLCDALRARSCEDIDLFENSLLSCEVLVSTTSLCGDSGAFGDLIRLICPNSCGECSASAEGCAGGAASLTLGEVLELMNAGVDAPANTTPTPAPEPTIGN